MSKQIFIIGSSRSGTTMMGRILSKHREVFTFKELHFFGTLWSKSSKKINKKESVLLLARLLCIQENGIFHQDKIYSFYPEAQDILCKYKTNDPIDIYKLFFDVYLTKTSSSISCEQTPNNIFYLEEILTFFPNAYIINMVRDQRDVLLSQKNKWKRRFLGASNIPLSEALRAYINYHPITIARIWNSCLLYSRKFKHNKQVKIIYFEKLLNSPENIIQDICTFLEIDFDLNMLRVPLVGSSTEDDNKKHMLIDSTKIMKWKSGGLNNAEIYLSQLFSNNMMEYFSYDLKQYRFPPLFCIFYIFTFPIKLGFSFLLNIRKMANINEVIKKRFFVK